MDIESAAVSAVKDAISMTDYLEEYIEEKDRGPSWDGHINVYSQAGNTHAKGKLVGQVPVQVKGKLIKDQSKEEVKYLVEADDLRNYRRVGGTLFFVVYIDNDNNKRIYYSALLPYAINKILKGDAATKKKISVTFQAFPKEKNEIVNLLMNFARDMGRQDLLKNGEYSLEEAKKDFDIAKLNYNFTYTGIGYNRSNPAEYLLKHDTYLYATNEAGNINIVVNHIAHAELVIETIMQSIGTGGKEYYSSYGVEHSRNGKEILIGKSFRIKIGENSMNIKYTLSGNLSERIRDVEFMLAIIDNHEIVINGVPLTISPTEEELKSFHLEESRKKLEYLKIVKNVLDSLGVKKELTFEKFGDKDEAYVRMLVRAFAYKQTIHFNSEIGNPIGPIEIGNLRIVLQFRPVEPLGYEVCDFFKTELDVSAQNENGEMVPTSQYTILMAEDYKTIDNIDFERIVSDFEKFDNRVHITRVNLNVLEMLKAYDQDQNCIPLEIPERLEQWLIEIDNDSSDLYKLNLFQCYLRKRKLMLCEKQELYQMLITWKDDPKMMAGICILLDEREEFRKHFEALSEVERAEFVDYPIYRLYKEER